MELIEGFIVEELNFRGLIEMWRYKTGNEFKSDKDGEHEIWILRFAVQALKIKAIPLKFRHSNKQE